MPGAGSRRCSPAPGRRRARTRAVLHESVVKEHLLAALDIPLGIEHASGRIDDPLRDRRLRLVGAVGEQPKNEKAEKDHQYDGLEPSPRNEQRPTISSHATLLSGTFEGAANIRRGADLCGAPRGSVVLTHQVAQLPRMLLSERRRRIAGSWQRSFP